MLILTGFQESQAEAADLTATGVHTKEFLKALFWVLECSLYMN